MYLYCGDVSVLGLSPRTDNSIKGCMVYARRCIIVSVPAQHYTNPISGLGNRRIRHDSINSINKFRNIRSKKLK